MSVYYGENKIKAMRKGTQRAIAIYKGSRLIFQEKMAVVADSQHVTLEGLPEFVLFNDPMVVNVAPEEGYALISVQVIMNGEDITSEVYANNTIAIPEVKGEITIAALASPPIVFEDPAVKEICVQYWGGQYIEGEITEYEASRVTNLGVDKNGDSINSDAGPFYANANISYFNEFRYFTGIVGRGLHWKNTGSTATTYRGRFAACSLKEITIPAIETTNLCGAFYYCSKLEEIDLSNLILNPTNTSDRRIAVAFTGCTAVKRVIFPSASIILDSTYQAFGGANSSACSNLEYIDFKNMDFRNYPTTSNTPNPMLRYCPKLAHLPSGMHNLAHSQSFAYNPLTHDSAVNLLMTLSTATGQTITFKATTYATLTEDEIAIGTDKGWMVTSA